MTKRPLNPARAAARVGRVRCFRMQAARMHKTRNRKLSLALPLIFVCSPAFAQIDQFLPEIDLYSKVHNGVRFQFQASQTREANEPVQAQFGPSVQWNSHPLPILTAIAKHDLDKTKTRVAVFSIGYRYLPAANGGAATNTRTRPEPDQNQT